MAGNTLADIEIKVRRLTRSPSTAQLSQADLDNYINTFVLYDFPEQLRTFNLRKTFTFYTNPFQDVYPTDTISFVGAVNNPLYNFQNLYLTVHPPVYVAGYQTLYTQSREQFFGIYPKLNSIMTTGINGDGVTTTFTGVITNNSQPLLVIPGLTQQSSTLLQSQILFDSLDTNHNGIAMIDVPVRSTTSGDATVVGNLYTPGLQPAVPPTIVDPNNNINYVTGAYTVTFKDLSGNPVAPGADQTINSQTVPTIVSIPQAVLYYANQFIVRPVPDQVYRVNFEVYKRPTELLASGQSPELEEYWQLIAYGASRKIFQDKMDMDSVALVEAEFREQMRLCLRRTIVQYTNERVATIYTEQSENNGSGGGWGMGGGLF